MQQDRREYFRVDTPLLLSWRIRSEREREDEDPLEGLNQQISDMVTELAPMQPSMCALLQLLNNKIDAVRDEARGGGQARRRVQVSISGSGAAFNVDQPVERGTAVEITIMLPTTNSPVSINAEVVGCQQVPTQHEQTLYRLRCHFSKGQDAITEQLVNFVSTVQQQQLAERRHLDHPDDIPD